MIMKKMNYIAPQITETELELEGFLCSSVVKAVYYVEVDEYVNTGEEVLNMDGYDY